MEAGVFYTDGGKRPMGTGWGVHGYTYAIDGNVIKAPRNQAQPTDIGYLDKVLKVSKFDAKGNEIITDQIKPFAEETAVSTEVDKSKDKTPLKKEPFNFKVNKAIPVKPKTFIDAWGRLDSEMSNNVAELSAMTYALDYAEEKGLKKIKVLSDSEYCILGTVNALKWRRDGWRNSRGLDVKNAELWEKTLKSIADAAQAGREVQFVWVRAHNGEKGNELADTSATKGLILNTIEGSAETVLQEEDAKTYGKAKLEYSRLLAFPIWYFRTNCGNEINLPDGTFQYYVGTHNNAPEMAGKRAIDHNFGVVRLNERVEVFDEVLTAQEKLLSSTEEVISFGLMSNIFKPDVLVELEKNGAQYFYPKEESFNKDVVMFDKLENGGVQLTHVARPPRISARVFDYCKLLDYVLDQYLSNDETVIVTDLTDDFQLKETSAKGKVKYSLQDAVKSNLSMMKIAVNHNLKAEGKKEFNIAIGFTVPSKNHLSRLIGKDFSIKFVTWKECDIAFRYAAIVESSDGIAIYAPHSNSVICK